MNKLTPVVFLWLYNLIPLLVFVDYFVYYMLECRMSAVTWWVLCTGCRVVVAFCA